MQQAEDTDGDELKSGVGGVHRNNGGRRKPPLKGIRARLRTLQPSRSRGYAVGEAWQGRRQGLFLAIGVDVRAVCTIEEVR